MKGADVRISLSMPGMYMGENVVRLAPQAAGVYQGTGVIVRCPSGKTTWQAAVSVRRGAAMETAAFVFEAP